MPPNLTSTFRAPYRTKVDLALEGLQQAILSGVIKPGTRLTVAQLSEQLEMSATPIREAIRLLEADGVITNEPHRGATVVDLSPGDADELYQIRATVESLATRLAAEEMTDPALDHLRDLHVAMKHAARSGDEESLTQANASWHLYLYSLSHAKYLPKMILRLWMPFQWGRVWVPERAAQSVEDHAEILKALELRDPERAAELMYEHLDTARRLVVSHLSAATQT